MSEKTLLVLGAGVNQISGIRAAVGQGLRVVTADWDLNNPGHRYSAMSHCVSTTDIDGVLAMAREEQIDGIITFASDAATLTVARVAEALGLPGIPSEIVNSLSDKGKLRALQQDNALPAPQFVASNDIEELEFAARSVPAPLMIKPVDSSGSRGITRVDAPDQDAIRSAIAAAKAYSRNGRVCIESFIEGQEVGGDGIVLEGNLVYSQCTQKHIRDFVVAGHSLPPDISAQSQEQVSRAVEDVCKAAGLDNAVVNFDVMLAPGQVCVIELSPRTGGNGIPSLLKAVTGIDPVEVAINLALGEEPNIGAMGSGAFSAAGSCVLGLIKGGVLEQIPSEESIRAKFPELLEFVFHAPEDMAVAPWTHGGASLGYCSFSMPSALSYDKSAAHVRALCGIDDGAS